jgi:transcriptional regulator with XRE-family HTH domain
MEALLRLDRDRLLRAREVLGYGLEKTAEEAGVSKNSVLRAEHGAEIRPVTARKIASALGVEVADLLGAGYPKSFEAPDTQLARSSLEEFEARLWGLSSEAEARALFEAVRRERSALEGWMTGYAAAPNDKRFARRQDFERVEEDLARARVYETVAGDHWSKLLDPRVAPRRGVAATAAEVIGAQELIRVLERNQAEQQRLFESGEAS